jgi:GNAT superfamily N-acetyltransferase
MQVRKLDRAAAAIDLLEPHEPASTMLLAPIIEHGLADEVHCWVAANPDDGRACGVLVIVSFHDRWLARPLLLDRSGAAPLATIVDSSNAANVHGPAEHVDPLAGHLQRCTSRVNADFLRLPHGTFNAEHAADQRVRIAELGDLDGLVRLYGRYELDQLSVGVQRAELRETLRRRIVVVAELGGELAGAFRLVGWTRRWAMWDELTVVPEARRQGLAWGLVHRAARETARSGRRWMTARNAANPMRFPAEMRSESSEWALVGLGPANPGRSSRRAAWPLAGDRTSQPG